MPKSLLLAGKHGMFLVCDIQIMMWSTLSFFAQVCIASRSQSAAGVTVLCCVTAGAGQGRALASSFVRYTATLSLYRRLPRTMHNIQPRRL
jgi:hypothetical protein